MIGETLLSRYKITEALGVGGMGEVYLAEDRELGRRVAIKFLPKGSGADADLIKRFQREAKAAAALNHPSIITIYDAGSHEGRPFLVMEHVEGEALSTVINRRDLPIDMALAIAIQICEGLAAAHEAGITHRDIKPDNILVDESGRVRILDFGLAKLTGTSVLTASDATVGTVNYMSPEQARGDEVDQRTDLFSLGVLLYEMLAGQRPFRGEHRAAVMYAIINEDPQPLRRYNLAASDELDTILAKLLAKNREERYPNAAAVIVDLRGEHRAESAASRSSSSSKRLRSGSRGALRRRRGLGVALWAPLVLGILALGWVFGRNSTRELGEQSANQTRDTPSEREFMLAGETPSERHFVLTADHVRRLSEPDPRLVGRAVRYLDNHVESDTLVFLVPPISGDSQRFESLLRLVSQRAVAPTLVGFEPIAPVRPALSIDDHLSVLRFLLEDLDRGHRPACTVIVGSSAGADLVLRLVASEDGPGIKLSGLIALGPNVSLKTCFASSRFATLEAHDPEGFLTLLRSIGENIESTQAWYRMQVLLVQMYPKFREDLSPLIRLSKDIVAPFETPGDPLAEWFRAAVETVPEVRCVFAHPEAVEAEELLSRHLKENILGDRFSEEAFVIEPGQHFELGNDDVILRYIGQVLEGIRAGSGR